MGSVMHTWPAHAVVATAGYAPSKCSRHLPETALDCCNILASNVSTGAHLAVTLNKLHCCRATSPVCTHAFQLNNVATHSRSSPTQGMKPVFSPLAYDSLQHMRPAASPTATTHNDQRPALQGCFQCSSAGHLHWHCAAFELSA